MKFGETQEKQIVVKTAKTKKYNTTDLDPETTFERHVFHRDQFAHYLRWTHILKVSKIGEIIVDFGCGKGNLLEVLYRNRFKAAKYIGIDIRKQTIQQAKEKYSKVDWAEFVAEDLIDRSQSSLELQSLQADKVCSFEVIEHVGKQNADVFLQNFRDCGKLDALYYLSTPNFNENVGAAGNHTYDSGDGRGVDVQEFKHEELKSILLKYFNIVEYFGTFASERDYKPFMNEWQINMFNSLKEYYDANLVSNIMAPMFPAQSRNTLWVLKRKQ
jgi:2-polyprenyl-3-methyl-5-hydroxy-6-metoxy-1,4-benzoquinol methylase